MACAAYGETLSDNMRKVIARSLRPAPMHDGSAIEVGQRIRHVLHGVGAVVRLQETTVIALFKDGMRREVSAADPGLELIQASPRRPVEHPPSSPQALRRRTGPIPWRLLSGSAIDALLKSGFREQTVGGTQVISCRDPSLRARLLELRQTEPHRWEARAASNSNVARTSAFNTTARAGRYLIDDALANFDVNAETKALLEVLGLQEQRLASASRQKAKKGRRLGRRFFVSGGLPSLGKRR